MDNNELCSFGDLPVNELMHCSIERMTTNDTPDDALIHSGVKGMKWGIRRYQNKDGSLTPAGKKRYNQELAKVREAEKVLKTKQATAAKIDKLNARKKAVADGEKEIDGFYSKDKKKSKSSDSAAPKKTAKDMSDVELQRAVNRMNLEKQYNALYSELNPKKVSAGKEFMKKLGKSLGDAAVEATKDAAKGYLTKTLKEMLGVSGKSDNKGNKGNQKNNAENSKNNKSDKNNKNNKNNKNAENNKNNGKDRKSDSNDDDNRSDNTNEKKTVYDGDVIGKGTSTGSSNRQQKSDPVDTNWYNVSVSGVPATVRSAGASYVNRNNTNSYNTPSTTRSLGQSYVNNILALPAPKNDD